MSFTRYEIEDSVASSEIVVRGAWSNDSNILTSFFTSSAQSTETQKYFLSVYNSSNTVSNNLQFDIQYGNLFGSGSVWFNPNTPGYSPTRDIYGQYRNLVYGTEDNNFVIDNDELKDIYVINIARSRYKESLKPGSFNLMLSGSNGIIQLTDNSNENNNISFIGSNMYYNVVSGSNGNKASGSINYGYIFPNLNIIVLSPSKLNGYIQNPVTSSNLDGFNNKKLFDSIKGGGSFQLQSQETVSSRYFFTRIKNNEYNYTTNPSIIDDQGNLIYSSLINNPQTFITTVGLYNDNNELLAVAKINKPLIKDFTKECLLRIKLNY